MAGNVLIKNANGNTVTLQNPDTNLADVVVDTSKIASKQYVDDADALKVALSSFTGTNQSLVGTGYQKLPGGLIIQWGTSVSTSNGGGGGAVTYPIAFPTSTFQPLICNGDNNIQLHHLSVIVSQVSNVGFGWASDLVNTQQRINWIALGY